VRPASRRLGTICAEIRLYIGGVGGIEEFNPGLRNRRHRLGMMRPRPRSPASAPQSKTLVNNPPPREAETNVVSCRLDRRRLAS